MSQTQSPPATLRSFRGLIVAAAAVVLTLVTLGFVSTSPGVDLRAKIVIVDSALVGAALCAALACGWTTWRSSGRSRAAWGLLCLTAVFWLIGSLIWFYLQVFQVTYSWPSWADAFYLGAMCTGAVGLVSFPREESRAGGRASSVVNALVVGGSVWFISTVVLSPVYDITAGGLAVMVRVGYPIGYVVLLTLAILLLVQAPIGNRLHLVLLALAFVVYGVSDSISAFLAGISSTLTGAAAVLGWIAGYLLLALAALAPSASGARAAALETANSSVVGSLVVYVAFLLAVVAAAVPSIANNPSLIVAGGFVLALFGVRQMLLAADNQALRRGLERKVAERTAELNRILNGVAEGIYGVDPTGRINFVNPAAATMLGYPSEELLGRSAHECFHAVSTETGPSGAEACHIDVALNSVEAIRRWDERYVRKDGSTFPVEVLASPIEADGTVIGAVAAFADITERRQVEKMKEEFISIVSHELRTPLTSIRGSLGLLAGGAVGPMPAAADRMIRIAVENSDRLTRLINDILDLERIGSGAIPMDFSVVDASHLVSATLTALQPVAADAGVALRTGTVTGRVHADSDRIIQALTNLVGNAIKFSPAGGCVTVDSREEGSHVTFRVADQGRGIPPDKLNAVFERFQQVDSSDAREKGGSGLGLPITKSIVERHGGRIWVESVLGEGSTFWFTVPAAKEPASVSPLGTGRHLPAAGHPTVLVCDDDPDILDVLGTLLQHQGYNTIPVARGRDAVDRALVDPPDVILLDLRMPGMSGWEAISELKSRPETHDIPIVVMSGLSPVADPDLALQTDGWLTKPINDQEIHRALSHALNEGKARPTVLVVEDDLDLATVLVALFERRGLHVVHAVTELEAVQRCREVQPDILVLDLDLPQGSGFGVVEALRRDGRLKQVPVIIYSAADLDMSSRNRLRLGQMVFLNKGRNSPQELERRVVEIVDSVASNGDKDAVGSRSLEPPT